MANGRMEGGWMDERHHARLRLTSGSSYVSARV